jgi:hypothetical protein
MIGDDDLRDCFAMFALNGILSCNYDVGENPATLAYKYADEMMEARIKREPEVGIVAVKSRRRK